MSFDDAALLIGIRRGDAGAWERLIARYEGRLLAFVDARLNDRAGAEDIVQETFLGFLTALPNYDEQTPVESFLFAIAAHKLTDAMRRKGRRPTMPLVVAGDSLADEAHRTNEPVGRERGASSLARSAERRVAEAQVLGDCLRGLIHSWYSRGEFERLQCIEMLFVLGRSNKEVAEHLGLSEQAVANHKSFVVGKLKDAAASARLRDVNWSRVTRDE